jgi:hypothetical protein
MSISAAKLSDSLAQLQQLFAKSDTSKNGTLSKSEFTAAATGIDGLAGASASDLSTQFASMDKNGDGELTKTELADGIKLGEQVQKALLMAQELMSGSTLMNMLSGSTASADSSAANMFSSGAEDTTANSSTSLAAILAGKDANEDTTSVDAYTAQLQQLIAKYNETASASIAEGTTTTVTQDA